MKPWRPSIYRINAAQTPTADCAAVPVLLEAISEQTVHLQNQPYDLASWNCRAETYLGAGYPELAVGDSYRADLLVDETPDPAEEMRKQRLQSYRTLGQALYDCHCHWEAADMWEEAARIFPESEARLKGAQIREYLRQKQLAAAPLGGTRQEQYDGLRDGGVCTVQYPWMEKRHRTRSKETIDLTNRELKDHLQPQSCSIKRSTLTDNDDMLGVFAMGDIKKGEYILLNPTATGICSTHDHRSCPNCYAEVISPHPSPCCSTIYCSTECRELATTYHPVLCGQDFSWLTSPAQGLEENGPPLRPLMMLRFLAASVQADTHPLDHPLIARLQSLSDREHVDVFTLIESVAMPYKILRQLGVDIFADQRYDTWVLHTIWTRLANNKAGSKDPKRGFVDVITPHHPLFNHSCEPNVEFRREEGSTTMRICTKRDIRQDEELFVSYRDVEGLTRDERVEALWPWFEGPCLCFRCRDQLEVT